MLIKQRLHELPTDRQLEVFYMIHQLHTQQYECDQANLGNVCLSNVMRSPELTLSSDQLSVSGAQGYRSAVGTHGVSSGTFYFESTYAFPQDYQSSAPVPPQYEPAVRVGFTTPAGHVDGPVGFDRCSFAVRSVDGSFCRGRKRLFQDDAEGVSHTGKRKILPGDVIGCLIHFPPDYHAHTQLPVEQEMCESRAVARVTAKRAEDVVLPEQLQQKFDIGEEIVPGSFISFYVNGELLGQFRDIPYNRYYPAVSPYNFAVVKVNFGIRNIRRPGYPTPFYTLTECLVDPLHPNENAKLDFGFEKLNVPAVLAELDAQRAAQIQARSDVKEELAPNQASQPTTVKQEELTTATSPCTEPSSVTNTQSGALTSKSCREEDVELLEIFASITPADVARVGNGRSAFRGFLRQLWLHMQAAEAPEANPVEGTADVRESQVPGDMALIKATYTAEQIASKGFVFPPRDVESFSPFTQLHKQRAIADYGKTAAQIHDSLYNVFLHLEIQKLLKEKDSMSRK